MFPESTINEGLTLNCHRKLRQYKHSLLRHRKDARVKTPVLDMLIHTSSIGVTTMVITLN